MKEQELNWKDFLTDILSHWRGFLIAMLLGSILVGLFGYGKAWADSARDERHNLWVEQKLEEKERERTEGVQEKREELAPLGEGELSEVELELLWRRDLLPQQEAAKVEVIAYQQKLYEREKMDYDNSAILQWNAQEIAKTELLFVVEADNREKACDAKAFYAQLAKGSEFYQRLAQKTDFREEEVRELVRQNEEEIAEDNPLLGLTFLAKEESDSKKIAESALEYLEEKQGDVQEVFGEHRLVLLSETYSKNPDSLLMNRQNEVLEKLFFLREELSNQEMDFSEEAWEYYLLLTTGEIDRDLLQKLAKESSKKVSLTNLAKVEVSQPGFRKEYALLGVLVGAFLYALWLVVCYIQNDHLRSVDNLEEVYGVAQLGRIQITQPPKGKLAFFDRFLFQLRKSDRTGLNEQEELLLGAERIRLAAKKEKKDKVLAVVDQADQRLEEYLLTMKEVLAKEGICLEVSVSPFLDAGRLKGLGEAQNVVLFEIVGKTRYSEITKMLSFLSEQNIAVMGYFLVE